MECQFVTTNGHSFRCTVCGRVLRQKTRQDPGKLHFRCGVKPQEKPAAKRRPRDPCRERRVAYLKPLPRLEDRWGDQFTGNASCLDGALPLTYSARKQTAKLADSDLVSTRELVCGPGCHAKRLLESLKINPILGCDCEAFARKMDEWGVSGCRGEHYSEIVTRFREYAGKYDWRTKLRAAMLAVTTGLAWKLDPLDPAPGIVEEAIRRAEAEDSITTGVRPRIAHVMPWALTTGGAQRMLDLWCAIEADRWETHIFSTQGRGAWKFSGAKVNVNMPEAKIAERLKQLAPDVVVFHRPSEATSIHVECPQAWIIHCMSVLRSAPPEGRPAVVFSNLDAAAHPGWSDLPLRVLPLGVDLDAFRPAPVAHEGLVCGIVGRLHEDKVPPSFVAALASWQPGPWRVRFIGHGLDSGYQTKTRKALAHCPWVEFAGDVLPDKMPDALRQLDALLIPTPLSRGETGSYALVEAMACGLPIVARDLEGLRFNGGAAPLFAKGDGELLARLRELDNPAKRESLGRRGRDLAERDHDLRRHVAAHSQAFADALRVDVSILMAVYNTPADYLRESWESILGQTCRRWELVLVDDGSTDRATAAEIDRLAADPRVRLLRLPTNGGLAAALNAGLPLCRSDLVARMDADDVMLPERLAKQVAYMRAHPAVAILGAQIQADRGGKLFPPTNHPAVITHEVIESQRASGPKGIWILNHPTVMFRRQEIQALGGYPSHRVAQDLALWLRAFRAGCVIHNLPDVVLRYRLHPGQLTAQGGRPDEYAKIIAEEWEANVDPYSTH